ncbi:MAG TPA: 16S rRNA (cytidine(1402)-2'-O)-methyltransferase [Pyrinomonadaceae bacterium]|nr:16S rRNA (cytidine(1402)-2'-O)-methyltransferase [Pyrinomonadaceae bacterium]
MTTMDETTPGTLFLVATPIGNLKDISQRALDVLRDSDLIACEDTRHTGRLLAHYSISNKLVSYHEHNETERTTELLKTISAGASVAVVSDAGTPGINDPGFRLVAAAREAGITVVPIPGPTAFVVAAISSGLPTDSLFFGGFLPSRKGERRRRLDEVRAVPATLIFYESPHRMAASLADCLEVLGDRRAAVARELTKLHEEIISGTITRLIDHFSSANLRGEFVLIIDREREGENRVESPEEALIIRVRELEEAGEDGRSAMKRAAKELGIPRSEAYRILQGLGGEK